MTYTNAQYADPNNQTIRCDINGVTFFVPCAVGNIDYIRIQELVAKDELTIAAYTPPPPTIPQSITRRQCAVELRERTLITAQEALDMTKYGDVPSMVSQVFASMSPNDKIIAETDFAADSYLRINPLLIQVMTATGATEEDIDDFFRSAATR